MPEQTDTTNVGTEASPLPRLAANPASDSPAAEEGDTDQLKSSHLRFKFTGVVPDGDRSTDGLIPVHLYPLMRFGSVRADYPVVIPSGHGRPVTLTSVIDEAVESLEFDDDEKERSRTAALRLESVMRQLADSDGPGELGSLWNAALEILAEQLDDDRRQSVLDRLNAVRAGIAVEGSVFPFGRNAATEMLRRAAADQAEARADSLRSELEGIRAGLRALLELDESESADAHSPDNLAASVGDAFGGDFDFDALSELMDQGPHGPSLGQERRERLELILGTLSEYTDSLDEITSGRQNVELATKPDDLIASGARHRDRCRDLVKSVQIARLELANEYREEVHGRQFEAFTSDRLTIADMASIPIDPIVVPGRLISKAEPVLEDILDGEVPVKVLVLIESLSGEESHPTTGKPLGLRLLAGGRPSAALFEAVLSDMGAVVDSLERAMAFPGPAVVCLFVGSEIGPDTLHPYLASAAAGDARAVPFFANDPASGVTWAERFSVDRNLDETEPWPVSDIRYYDATGNEVVEQWPFTAADLLSMGLGADADFMRIGADEWHDDLVPISEYLALDRRDRKTPFILLVSEEGELLRVVCSERIVRQTERVAATWRALQELAGIDNSHAEKVLADERAKMQAETDERVAALEAEFERNLDQKTGTLAEQIVSNIAAGLLGADLTAVPTARPPSGTPTDDTSKPESSSGSTGQDEDVTTTEEAEQAEAGTGEIEEEEDEISFDEAYIETPRCTACDECTTINPRMFAYNSDKQAYIADVNAGTFREMVLAAEKCPVKIIHPGKPTNNEEPHLDELVARAEAFQ